MLRVPLRRPALALGLIVLGTLAALAWVPTLRKDVRIEKIFPERDPRRAAYLEFKDVFGRDDVTAFVAVEFPGSVLSADTMARVHSLTEGMREHPLVDAARLVSLSNAPVARTDAADWVEIGPLYTPDHADGWDPALAEVLVQGNPALEDRLLSRDRRLAGFLIPLDPNADPARPGDPDDAVRKEFARDVLAYFSTAGALQPGEQAWLEGFAITNYRVMGLLNSDLTTFFPATFGLIFLTLGLVFRRLLPTFVAMTVMAVCTLWTLGLMAAFDFPFSFMSSAIPVMVLVVCVGDCVHLIAAYQGGLARGLEAEVALRNAVADVGRACFYTSVTTAAGFAALASSQVEIVRELGIPVAMGVLIAYVVSFTLLPPLLRWLPSQPRTGPRLLDRPLRSLALFVQRRPGLVAGSIGAVALGAAALIPSISRETRLLQAFDESSPLIQTRRFFEERLGGVAPLELFIDTGTPGGALEPDVQQGLLSLGRELRGEAFREQGVLSALSIADFLSDAWYVLEGRDPAARGGLPDSAEGLAEVHLLYWFSGEDPTSPYVDVTDEPQRLRMQLRVKNTFTSEFFALAAAVEQAARRHLPDHVRVQATGMTVMSQAIHASLTTEMAWSMGTAFVLVGVLVLVFFRSFELAVLGLLPNLLPLLFVLALMALSGTALSMSTSVVFSIVFGISVDDTIHFVAALAHSEQGSLTERVTTTVRRTGASLVLSSVVLVVGFAVLWVSNFPTNRTFGFLVAATVVFALVGDLLFLPALLHLRARASARN